MKKFFLKNWKLIVIIFLAFVFALITSSYNYIAQSHDYVKWGSPDENANYVFSKDYAQGGDLTIKERYNLYSGGLIHPRSFKSDGPWLKPLSFLGIILLYGKIALIFGVDILPYLSPIFAGIGIIFFYLFIKRIFTEKIAFLSSLILFSFPVYLYYSVRSMFHNVLFVVFFIIFLYLLTYIPKIKTIDKNKSARFLSHKPKWSYIYPLLASYFSGLFLAIAISIRTSEIIWLFPILILAWFFYFKRISFIKIILFLGGLFTGILPMFYYNQILYGAFWQGGYSEMNDSLLTMGKSSSDLVKSAVSKQTDVLKQAWTSIKDTVFYFGFKPWQSIQMFIIYFAKMFWYLFIPFALGFLLLLSKIYKWPRRLYLYILSLLLLSVILIFYYGSWKFTDNPDATSHTIGNSYTRYWLPIYLGVMPIIVIFLQRLVNLLIPRKVFLSNFIKNSMLFLVIILIYLLSFNYLLFGSEEGLYYTYFNFKKDQKNIEKVWNNTEENAVIITEYHDKLLFPERKVIRGLLSDQNMNYYYSKVARYLPLYYFNFTFPEKDFNYLNERKLKEVGLSIEFEKEISSEFSLYKLNPLPKLELEN